MFTSQLLGNSISLLDLFALLLFKLTKPLFFLLLEQESLFFLLLCNNALSFLSKPFIFLFLSFKFNLSTFLILFLEAKLLFHSLGLQLSGRLLAFLHQLDVAGVLGADSGQISDLFGLGDAVDQLL